jgi:hypothetical protein
MLRRGVPSVNVALINVYAFFRRQQLHCIIASMNTDEASVPASGDSIRGRTRITDGPSIERLDSGAPKSPRLQGGRFLTPSQNETVVCAPETQINWITPDLLDETQQVWSEIYGRDISAAEATEILLNVKRLASAVARLVREQ